MRDARHTHRSILLPGHYPTPMPRQFFSKYRPRTGPLGRRRDRARLRHRPFHYAWTRGMSVPELLLAGWPYPRHPSLLMDSGCSCCPGNRQLLGPARPARQGESSLCRELAGPAPDLTATLSVPGSGDTRGPARGVPGIRTLLSTSLPFVTDTQPWRAGPGGVAQSPKQRSLFCHLNVKAPKDSTWAGGGVGTLRAKGHQLQGRHGMIGRGLPLYMSPWGPASLRFKHGAAYLTLVCRLTYRLWKLFVLSMWPALGPCSLWMISAFISMAMWAGSRESRSRS